MNAEEASSKLVSALTQYDVRQSRKCGWNPHALPLYFEAVERIVEDIRLGADTRAAVCAGLSGRVADTCLRALGLPITTREEAAGGMYYRPVSAGHSQA
jgi:hypothetical protein